jgi:hypothetical protein
MMHRAALGAILLALTNCGGSSIPILTETRPACPPSLRADVPGPPYLSSAAGLVRPIGPERLAYEAFFRDVATLRDHDGDMTRRALVAKQWCDAQAAQPPD